MERRCSYLQRTQSSWCDAFSYGLPSDKIPKRIRRLFQMAERKNQMMCAQEFNKLLSESRHRLKILGDWTIRYILENKDELLLNKKYNCYDIGRIVLEKFYEFAGVPVPEWLTPL